MLTGFFDTLDQIGTILLSDIKRIVDPPVIGSRDQPGRLVLHDGRSTALHASDRERLMARPVQLIPSEPRTFVVWTGDHETSEPWILRAPVVAWALCLDGEVRPVTPNGVNDAQPYTACTYVEMPDGTVQAVGEWCSPSTYTSAAEMLASQMLEARKRDERARAAASEVQS